MSRQKREFLNEGLLKVPSLELLRNQSLPTCRGYLILKSSGKFRLISVPTSFNARFRQAGGLVDFLRFLRDQVPFVFRPSLPNIPSAFATLSNLRALFPVGQKFYLARMDIADCFNSIDHRLLMSVFKKTVKKAMLFSSMPFSGQFIISELSFFLNNYVIQFAGSRLLQARGIPQGSCISTDLSNLFLAYVDRKSQVNTYFWDAQKKISSALERCEGGVAPQFDLRPNFSKENSGIHEGFASVEWLGLEITPYLDLLIPLVNTGPRIFDRFGGYPLPWKDCLSRLKACLQTSTHIKLAVTQRGFALNASVAEENARRIGLYFGHLLIVYIWPCLERRIHLTSFKHSRQLAKILICRLGILLECPSLLSLARDSLVQTLLQRRSEFRLLLRFFYEPRLILPVPMQKIFSIETYLGPLLMRYIGKYVKLRDDQFQLSLWGGDAVLNYVELQYDIFEDLIPLPVGFKSGHIHELRIQVPWTRLGSSSVVITLNTVECVLAFKRPGEQRQQFQSEADTPMPSDTPQPPSYLLSYLTRIWSNIEVAVKNLIVKFVEGDTVLSLNIRSLDCFPTLPNWQRGVEAQSAGNYCLHRLLRLTDMTLCIDRCDAKGHISTYQDPVIYRSSFDIRLRTVFTQDNKGLASICVANLFSPQSVEINLNQVQIPLITRILEILFALSNKIIRWEALSDNELLEIPQTDSQHKEFVVDSNEEDLARNQSWSQWAWSFIPSFPSFSFTSSEDEIYNFNQDDISLEYIEKLRLCEARAEYVRLLYEDGIASTEEAGKMAQYRRGRLYLLRKHKKPLPALVLGVLMKRIRFHIKAANRIFQSESTQHKASITKNLRPNESTFNLFTIIIENLGFQCVQDSGYFTSLQIGVGLLQISPFGEVCPCGKKYTMLFPLHDLLELHSKSELITGSESSDPLIKAFCGLFGAETSHSSDVVKTSISENHCDSSRGVVDSQPSLPNSFVLPPFCRKDYHSTYGSDYPLPELPLALWFESVFSREDEEESIKDNSNCLLDPDPTLYSFGRLFLDKVKVNLTLTTSHRLQHFLELLAEGSKNYKACSDWASLYFLPQQEPVDSWILQERMVRLRSFTPVSVKRAQILSLCVEIFPPTHDHHVANRFASLKLETGSIDTFVSAPLNPVQLVFTMTHLYPSSGVLVDVKSSFHQSLLHDNILDCKHWGGKEQISDCYGIYRSTGEQQEDDAKEGGVLFGFDDENPITKPLQIDLLNSCYTHRLVEISKMRISLGQEVLLSPVSITSAQRNLLFSKSWPQHLSNDLVTAESYVKFHSQPQLNLSSSAVRSLFIHGFYVVSHGCALATALSHYLHSQVWSEVSEYSGQLSEDGFGTFFDQTVEGETPCCLTFSAKGFVSLHAQSSKNQNIVKLSFETSKLMGKLMDVSNDKVIPILECASSEPSVVFSYQLVRKVSHDLESSHPASVTLKVAPVKFLISSSLIEWSIGVVNVLKTSWKAFDVEQTGKFPLGVQFCSKSQGSLRLHQMDTHTHSPSPTNSLFETISTRSRPHALEASTPILVSTHAKLQNCSNSPSLPFSEWIIANYKWFTACKLDICQVTILASTLYIVPTMDLLSTCDFDTWLTSLSATSRSKVIQLTLPRVEIKGPCSHPFSLPQSQNAPPLAPLSTTEGICGIQLYAFELEDKQSLRTQRQLRHPRSVSEMGVVDLDSNHPMWECTATGIAISVGEATRLLQLVDLTCTLSFIITTSQPGNAISRISWNLLFNIAHSTNNTSGDPPCLRDVTHFLAAISSIQMRISNLMSEIFATKDLVISRIRESKNVDSFSNASMPVEVAPRATNPSGSTKRSLSMVSRVTYSSHSLAESRNARAPLASLDIPRTTISRIPIKGTIQVTLPITTGELCLNDKRSKILWEADDFSSTISISDSPFCVNFRLQLERICLFLQTSGRNFPLISPKHWHIRPFQNVSLCPGTAYYEESKADQRRPKPQEPQGADSDNEVYVPLSRHLQPTALITVSLTRSPAVLTRRVFAGKRFSHWLDRQSELFLQGEDRTEVDDVSPPFVNCVYIKLKPLDVVLCPQLLLYLKNVLKELRKSGKTVFNNDRRFFDVKAPLPGHCMPLLFIAFDELRLFVPSPGLLSPTHGVIGPCDSLAITLRAIQVHPFPKNCITSRPEAAPGRARAITLTSKIGSSYEDRQFALRLEGLACWAVSFFEALNFSESARSFDYQPTLAGQYPAFEWNQAATRLNDIKDAVWVLPVLRPLDITTIFAAPVCETNLRRGQTRLIYSSVLEVNISNDIIVTLNGSFLLAYLSNLISVSEQPMEQTDKKAEVNQMAWLFQPSRILLTCGLVRFVLWERRKFAKRRWDFSIIDLIQPHLRWSPEALNAGLNDLQVHLRTFSEGSESDWHDSVFWTPTTLRAEHQTYLPTRLPLPRVTEIGQSQIFNPVSLIEKEKYFHAIVRIQRETTLVFTPSMLMCLSNLTKSFCLPNSPTERAKSAGGFQALITIFTTIFSQLHFETRSFSLHLISAEDESRFATEGIQMDGVANRKKDWRSFYADLKVMCIDAHLNEFKIIPTATEISFRLRAEVSPVSIPTTIVHIEISRGTKIVIPFGNEFKRLAEAFVVAMRQESSGVLNLKKPTTRHLPSRCVFKDDIRSDSTYDFSVFVPTEHAGFGDISRWLPLPYEVVFAECDQFTLRDDAEPRCVTMTWTFPELRQPVRLTVNPMPFVYDNDVGDLGIVMLPARLQYWNDYVGEYGSFVTYATFNLIEDAPIDVLLPPTLAEFPHCSETLIQAQRQQLIRGSSLGKGDFLWGPIAALNSTTPLPVAATSWRIIVSCVGRVVSMGNSAPTECDSVAIPVSLSPYALAACTHLDSAYIPEFITPVSLDIRIDDFCLSTWQMSDPSLETGRLTVLKLRGILASSFTNPRNQALTIASAVSQSITLADSSLLASFSVGSVAIHVFSPHGAHMQLLGEAERIFGMSGACISVAACHLHCNSDLVYALSQITTGEGKMGWEIGNRTDRRLLVDQYFTYASLTDEPAASALSNITSVTVEAGGCFSSWRPIVLANSQTITLRIALSTGTRSMVRSAPIPITWPPEHAKSTFAQPIQWDDSESQGDFFPLAILLIPPRPSSGLPGEIIVQPTLTIENKLPFELSLHFPNGSTRCIASSSSYGLCVSPRATPDLALSAFDNSASVTLTSEDLIAQGERILWLPITETVCPVLFKVNHLYHEMLSDSVRVITITPVLNITSMLPVPLTLVLEASCKSLASFVCSSGRRFSRYSYISKESTTSVVIAFKPDTIPAFNFRYPDKTLVFESSLLLPWRKLSRHLDVVVKPWLLITNRSGICLQLSTASSLKGINLPDESAVRLDPDSCHIPAAGERLFRFGINFKGNTVWSPALLVHSSVFLSSTAAASEAVTLTVFGVSRAQQQPNHDRAAVAEAVVSLTRSRTLVPLALRLGGVVCCLAARLQLAPSRGVVALSIEPLLRVDNRTGQSLLCKPIVTPTPHVHLPLPMASLDGLEAEVLAIPKSGSTLTPILFWNHSHPEVVFEDVDSHGVSFAHLLVLRSHLGIFWSRSLHLIGVYSFVGVRSCSATEPYHRYYHISLPSFNENGDSDVCSILLDLSKDLQTGLWTLFLDNFPASLSCSLGCSLTNTTDFPFEATFHGVSEFHQLPVSNALPCVQPSGGKLVLIPQISLDHLAGGWVSGKTSETSTSATFLCHEDAYLFLRLHSDDVVIKLGDCRDNPVPLRFGDKTVLIQHIATEPFPFCTHLAIFTEQKPMFLHWSHVDQPLCLTVTIDTTLIFASARGSLLAPGESGLKDFLRICIRRIEATYLKKDNTSPFEFSITSSLMQIDNLAQISLSTFDFPVLMRSVLPHTMEESSTGVSSCTFRIRYLSSTDFILDRFDLCLPSMEAYLEDSVLYALASWVQDLRGALHAWAGGDVENGVKSPTSTMLCISRFEIHPVSMQLALKVKVGMHISCKTTQFRLNRFECLEAALDMKTLLSQLSAHYISQVLIRAGLVLGSLELIGNPACLVASFAEGVWDLVHFADREKMATREQMSLLRGLARGLVSLAKHTAGGVCSSLTGLASSVARNLHELSLDAEHIRRTTEIRQHHQPAGLGEGLALGISELGISLLDLSSPSPSESPRHRLTRVAEGFAGGVGRGLVGLFTKPLAGVADFVAFTGTGFMHGMGTGWGITPSPNHMCCSTNFSGSTHLVDEVLLHKWSCALMRRLNILHPHEYLWTGVSVDATGTILTWLCLPCRESLFTVEFDAPIQTVRAGFLAVDFVDANQGVLIDRYQLSAGERAVLMRVLRRTKNTATSVKGGDVSGDLEAGPHLERVRAYLSSLPHSEGSEGSTQ
ncbi:Vacuolar protein sorting-associated protein 13B [Taenia crassiceps]|uniref:Vacuolar protein sorting-associated protein 13B n=1 Tax=Taenia crassiceps TaxID=6207 RepID=A0ABR4QMS1_9CEST